MRPLILIFLAFFIQENKIVILNQITHEPIQSASIKFYKDGITIKSAITDEKGEFNYNFTYDSINVSSIGFNEKTIKNNNKDNNKTIIYLSEKQILLEEVGINSSKKTKVLGKYEKKNSEFRSITKDENFALLLENKTKKTLKIKSLLLNLKEVNHKTDMICNIYQVDTIQRKYINPNKTQVTLTEYIPNTNKLLGSLNFTLEKNKKGLVEINASSIESLITSKFFFIALHVTNTYTDSGEKINTSNINLFPKIYMHKTKENNYCIKISEKDNYWKNINLVEREGEANDDFHPLTSMNYYDPSISIKVIELE